MSITTRTGLDVYLAQGVVASAIATVPSAASKVLFWAVDDNALPTVHLDCWVVLTSPAGVVAATLVGANTRFLFEKQSGEEGWQYQVAAFAGVADINALIS